MRAIIISLLLSLWGVHIGAYPHIVTEDTAENGSSIAVLVISDRFNPVKYIELRAGDGSIVSRNGLFFLDSERGFSLSAGLLGIPVTTDIGVYGLTIEGCEYPAAEITTVEIVERAVVRAEIHLNGPMTDLRLSDAERKVRESAELWAILATISTDAVYHTGRFRPPLMEGITSSPFAERRLFAYSDGGTDRSIHSGVDIAAEIGVPVYSVGNGVVVLAKERMLTGLTVVLEHLPGVYSLYYHLDELRLMAGEYIEIGAQIGTVGATGLVTGPHLHWEFRVGGVPVDPLVLLELNLLDKAMEFHKITDYESLEGR